MAHKKTLYIGIGVGIILLTSSLLVLYYPEQKPSTLESNQSSYAVANLLLKQELSKHDIDMSSPIKLKEQEDISKYCSLFADDKKQKLVQYCTSTEIKDKSAIFLGNIHMVGTLDEQKTIISLVQTDSSMSQIDEVKTIFETTIVSMVCDCWDAKKPGSLDNVGAWIEGLREFHTNGAKPHSKSSMIYLENKSLQLELTTNNDGYLWQLYIYS